MNTHIIPNGPSICVTLSLVKGSLFNVTLSRSDQFTCCWPKGENPESYLAWLEAYANKQNLPIALNLGGLPPFQRKALTLLQTIPFGETQSYKQVAIGIEQPKAARAIGGACHRNPYPLFIPCHRVITSQGKIGGFAYDLGVKAELLRFEDTLP